LSVAAAFRAGRLRDELPERRLADLALDPAPTAAVARNDQRPRFGAAATTGRTRREVAESDVARRAGVRLFERDLDVVAQIAAAQWPVCARVLET